MLLARFDEPLALAADERVALLGGKGDGLMRMAAELALPVPPGFVLTTRACRLYLEHGWTEALDAALREGMAALEAKTGRRFGPGVASGVSPSAEQAGEGARRGPGIRPGPGASADDPMPLLVSVRSGAPVSMPGMLDTLLNVGLDADAAMALQRVDPGFGQNCQTRLAETFAASLGEAPPARAADQLRRAVEAVFRSVRSPRAAAYRRREGLADELVTAVNVQAMVFGNLDARSATGVYFTRDPATGEARPYGDVLFRAQGEDVVSGRHPTQPLSALEQALPDVARSLYAIGARLERAYRDLVEIEFTVERGRLWLLQVRVGKRSPRAAVRIAAELARDPAFPLERREAVIRVRDVLMRSPIASRTRGADDASRADPARTCLARGLAASPGLASGELATTIEGALAAAEAGRAVILARPETSPEDVEGMAVAAGLLTARGGLASHAAVVARGWGIPAVVGVAELVIEPDGIRLGATRIAVGEPISLDGDAGEVLSGRIAMPVRVEPELETLRAWARELGLALEGEGAATVAPAAPAANASAGAGANAGGSASAPSPSASGATASPALDGASPAPLDEAVLHALSIKGLASADALKAATEAEAASLSARLDALVADGLLVAAKPLGFRLTETGRARAEQALERDREALGREAAHAALLAFQPLDARMKRTVTDWQLRPAGGELAPNDHTDARWDADVMARLGALVDEASPWLVAIAERLPRLHGHARRLRHALDAARAGDGRFVASPRVDSLHGIWFELHEDLIRLAGSTRAAEAAAGRAS